MYQITNAERRLILELLTQVGEELKTANSTRSQNKGRLARLLVRKLSNQKPL